MTEQSVLRAPGATQFPTLLSPLDRGRLHLKNRVVFPGHQTLLSAGGIVGERMLGYYAERAMGGVGAVIVEGAAVHRTTVKFTDYLLAYDERIVASLDRLADRLGEYDCRTILQLAHSGSRMSTFDSRRELWAPSAVRSAISPEIPHAMSLDQIEELIEGYRASARNVARSRIDGIEIHSAHEYLLGEFLSPINNLREDDYGGSLENRMRLLMQVIDVVREEVGDEMVVGIRINGSDLISGGLESDDYVEICSIISGTGLIDYISVSAGTSADNNRIVPSMDWPQGLNVPLASAIRQRVDVPVIAVGRIKRPEHAEQVLADGHADVVAEARALIADPEWVNKAARAPAEIRPCIGCNQGCFGFLYGNHPISCTVNPAVGQERDFGIGTRRHRMRSRVLVVGGGPAGLEAAVAAAESGHEVILCERTDALGGQVLAASSIDTRKELREIVDFQIAEIARLGVELRMTTEVDHGLVESVEPDVIVIATGSRPPVDPIPHDGSVAVAAPYDAMLTPLDELPNGDVVVIDGVGHFQAYAPAERLADAGRSVSVVSSGLAPAANLDQSTQLSTLRRLGAKGVRFINSTRVTEIKSGAVETVGVFSLEPRRIEASLVIAALGNVANDGLVEQLSGSGREIHAIGDAVAPRTMLHGIREGRLVGSSLGRSSGPAGVPGAGWVASPV
ncbi:MAG: FAD-dependent oxidoreductase [Microthrixaceae bacterium]